MTAWRFVNRREYFKWENMRLEINQPTTFTTLGKLYNQLESYFPELRHANYDNNNNHRVIEKCFV